MGTVTNNSSLGVPGVADNFGTVLTINSNALTGVRTDNNSAFATGSSLTMRDSVLVTDRFTFNTNIGGSEDVFSGTNSRVHFTFDDPADANVSWYGRHSFDNHTFLFDDDDSDVRYLVGGSGESASWQMDVGDGGVSFVNYNSAQLILHGASLKAVTGTGAISLIGNSFSQASANVSIYAIAAANAASAEAFDGAYDTDWGYSYRFAHQAGLGSSVNDISAGTGGRVALYTDFDLTEIVRPGSIGYTTTTQSSNARQSVLQMNYSVALWVLDPVMSNEIGAVNEGSNLHVGFHDGRAPGSNGSGGNSDSEIRFFISDRVVGRNAATGGVVDGDFKIRYSHNTRLMPDAWDNNNVPLNQTDNDVSFTQDSAADEPSQYKGAMVQASRRRYGSGTATDTAATDTNTEAGRNPANNSFPTLPTNRTRIMRHFDFDFGYSSSVVPNYTGGSSALVVMNERRIDGSSVSAYLNSRTAVTAPQSAVTDFADVYPSLRRAFFDGAPIGEMPVTGSGTTLTFDRAVSFDTSGNSTYTSNLATVGSTGADSTLTGDNTIYNFGAHSVNWNTKRVPAGMTLQGGTHNNLNANVSSGGYVVAGTLTLNLNRASGTITGLDDLLGSVTYSAGSNVTLSNSNALTVQINEADIPAEISYTTGSDSLGTNITREDVPTGAATRIIRVPTNQLTGFFAVRNITTDNELVAPIAVASMSSYTVSTSTDESTYNPATDTLRFYWRPTVNSTEAYNTTVFDFTGTVTEGTTDLAPQRIAAVLWESVVSTDVGSSTSEIVDGSFDHNSVDRFALNFTNALLGTSDAAAQAKTLYLGLLATNDIQYLERMVDNELASGEDIIAPGINELIVDTDYAYVTSGDLTVQQQVTSISGSAGSTGTLVPQDLSIGAVSSVIILPNPAGATPAVIASAVGTGVAVGVDNSDAANGIGWLISNGDPANLLPKGGKLLGLKPKKLDYDNSEDYRTIL